MSPVATEWEWIRNRMVQDTRMRQGALWRYIEAELKRINVVRVAEGPARWSDRDEYTR